MEEKRFRKRMYANEYAAYSDYPLFTIKCWCKDGTIPCDRIGRKYLIDVQEADFALKERRGAVLISVPIQPQKEMAIRVPRCKQPKKIDGKKSEFLQEIEKLKKKA